MLEKMIAKTRTFFRMALIAGMFTALSCKENSDPLKPDPVHDPYPVPDPVVHYLPASFLNDWSINWISYAPTNFNPEQHKFPSEESIRQDIRKLVGCNYKGLITYGADSILGRVPGIAQEEGVKGFIMGIWDITSKEEFDNAVRSKDFVDAYCVGNEGLANSRYNRNELIHVMDSLRTIVLKPVTTTEPMPSYDAEMIKIGDWPFPNSHPYWTGITDPEAAAKWTKQQYDRLDAMTDRHLMFKEVGLPTSGENNLNEDNQNKYYNYLESLMGPYSVAFSYFEAFDQPWKDNMPVEPHWGIFDKDRNPKKTALPQIIYITVPKKGTYNNLYGMVRNVTPEDYSVSNYLFVNGGWWVKPYWSSPLVSIWSSGEWSCDMTTGGIDENATQYMTYLVLPDFNPNAYSPPSLPPNAVNNKVKAYVTVNR